jgi:Rrf2 family iron-sulfur cluster assembly transcriptional regulator
MLTVRTGYAILALACLHDNEDRWVLAQEIASRSDIPKPYLHKILHALGKAGVIQTKRGYRGGMSLSKPAEEITLFDLVKAVEGSRWMNRCLLGLSECSDERACPTHAFWSEQRKLIEKKLKSINLAEVAEFESHENGRLKSLSQVREHLANIA